MWSTLWRTRGKVKGKLAIVVVSQYPSHYLGTRCIQHYYRWCAYLGCAAVDWIDAQRADLNGLVRLARKTNSGFCACVITFQLASSTSSRVQLKCDGARWRRVGKWRGKLANAVGSQYPSHYLGTRFIQHYYRWCAHLGCAVVHWTDAPSTPSPDLNGLVRSLERRNLVSAHVPSYFKRRLHQKFKTGAFHAFRIQL
jgi:hypothetical protein